MDWQSLGGRENNVKVGNYNPDFMVGGQVNLSYKRFSLGLSLDWRQGGEFMSFTYRYGESDWKSQRQLDNLASLLDGKPHSLPDFASALSVQQIIEALIWT